MEAREIMLAVGGWPVPRTFYSHVVVQLASVQDFKPSWNSQIGPSVAKSPDPDQGSGMYFAVNEKKDHSQKPNMKKGQEL